MVVGTGDIASVLPERKDLLFFASGVSNSQETDETEYQRELDLLSEQSRSAHLVYFSSLSIFYSNTRYTRHKRSIERRVKANFSKYCIIRLGNISWGDNPHTLINFFRNKLKAREPFGIKDEYRYLIDEEEFLHWIDLIPDWSCEMNCPGQMMKVQEIVDYLKQELKDEESN